MIDKQERNSFIDFIKFFACIFITNSHCMYTNPLFKVGGGWGNAIFFAVSGFLLGNIRMDFYPWIIKRWKRVFPLTALMTIIAVFTYGIESTGLIYHATRFWFILALLIYFIPFYFADRYKNGYYIAVIVHLIGYVLLYCCIYDKHTFFVELGGFSPFKVYFYLFIMLCGGLINKNRSNILNSKVKPIIFVTVGLVGMLLWLVEYYEVNVLGSLLQFQFLIHVGMSIFGLSVLLWAIVMNEYYKSFFLPHIVKAIADSTLEIYLVQIVFLPLVNALKYPICLMVFWGVAIMGGIILHMVVGLITNNKVER